MPTIQLKQRAMQLSIRPAGPQDITIVAEILREAARWLEENSMAMWRQGELLPGTVAADVHSGLFFLAAWDGEPAGTIRYQLEDALFWPDVPQDDSALRSSPRCQKTLCRKRGFLGSAPVGYFTHARSRPALPSFGLRDVPAAPASGL